MRVVKWLTGLLYKLALHHQVLGSSLPPQAGPGHRGATSGARWGEGQREREDGGGGERLCPLGDRSPAGALGTPGSVSPKHPRRLRLCGVSRNRAREGPRLPSGTTQPRGREGRNGEGASGHG